MRKEMNRIRDLAGSFLIAISMYSRIPVSTISWTDRRMRYALCFFPVIGLAVGAADIFFIWLCSWLEAGEFFRACGLTAIPLLITGGIHLDGYLDVTDARSSCGDREKKLEILKDPRAGAFAVIGCGVYLLLYAGAVSQLGKQELLLLPGILVLERALSGFSVVCFPKARKDGLAAGFSKAAAKETVAALLMVTAVACMAVLWYVGGICGLAVIFSCLVTFGCYYRMSMREFGGINGDLAGHFLQSCERNAVIILALFGMLLR